MFSKIGFTEIALIVGVALLIFGPSKLPQLGKSVGEGLRELKKSMKSVTDEVAPGVADLKKEIDEVKKL
ncbi:MAG TPA: twin-arginine translocase TatA/TatE family subunit [Symbiobacteriaceae bacterium]|jgi:sec-independent protein translocase protein TatA|nr:twin-arginine translocase TatA/TatE family subunit [Symbiobacteriaceae bacterium]